MVGVMPDNAVELQKKLPGVGRYTAGTNFSNSMVNQTQFFKENLFNIAILNLKSK